MSYGLEATYYRTALLLGLIKGEDVHGWAEAIIQRDPTPPQELLELVLTAPTDLSALRHGLWPLVVEPEPPEVLAAIFGLLRSDLTSGRHTVEETVMILRQMRSMLRLPAPTYSDLNEALVSHGLARDTGGTIAAWLEQFADAPESLLGFDPRARAPS